MAKEDVTTLDALTLDGRNFNRHTEQGMSLLEKSLRELGAGRSILVDKNNNIIAGNGIVEAAGKAGITRVRVVEVQGDELVAVKRTDMSLDSHKGRKMALADNATAAADLSWDTDTLQEVADEFDIDTEEWGVEMPEIAVNEEQQQSSQDSYVIKYEIVFDNEQQQDNWFNFLKQLRQNFPDYDTIAERLDAAIRELWQSK